MNAKINNRLFKPQRKADGFTLTELLVVLGTIAVLALVLTPALAATRPNSKAAQCLNDKRQLTIAWQMYAADNSDSLIDQVRWISQNSYMDWTTSFKNFDADYLTNSSYSLIASYNKNTSIFKCPADYYLSSAQIAANMTPRLRSVSINGVLGSGSSGPEVLGSAPNGGRYFGHSTAGIGAGRTCQKLNDLSRPGPANTFVFLDEQADSIDDGIFMFDLVASFSSEYWRNLPASYHNGAVGISFADGHAEMHKWVETGGTTPPEKARRTIFPVTTIYTSSTTPYWGHSILFSSSLDYAWMQARMPYR